jgi:hypothetical protein
VLHQVQQLHRLAAAALSARRRRMTHGLQRNAEEYRPRAPRTIKEIMKVWGCC